MIIGTGATGIAAACAHWTDWFDEVQAHSTPTIVQDNVAELTSIGAADANGKRHGLEDLKHFFKQENCPFPDIEVVIVAKSHKEEKVRLEDAPRQRDFQGFRFKIISGEDTLLFNFTTEDIEPGQDSGRNGPRKYHGATNRVFTKSTVQEGEEQEFEANIIVLRNGVYPFVASKDGAVASNED